MNPTENKDLERAIEHADNFFAALNKSNADAICYHLRKGEPFAGLTQEALSVWIEHQVSMNDIVDTLLTAAKRSIELEKHLYQMKCRSLINAVNRICEKCGHTKCEDGCAFCMSKEYEIYRGDAQGLAETIKDLQSQLTAMTKERDEWKEEAKILREIVNTFHNTSQP